MSVYTNLTKPELSTLLHTFDVGQLTSFQGISEGIENTNYFVNSKLDGKANHFVLTIFEALGMDELPYFLELTAFLAEQNLPCAHPVANKHNQYLQTFKNKPAALVQRLNGRSAESPGIIHCAQVGEVLGQMHAASNQFPLRRKNPRGYAWYCEAAEQVKSHLSDTENALLNTELNFQSQLQGLQLPSGVIHGDLFRDNILFDDTKLSGVIDFYYACDGYYLYDLAITVNDWCSLSDGSLNTANTHSLIEAYNKTRPLSTIEQTFWPAMLRAAALRFWLSRLIDWHFPRTGVLTHSHDPDVLRKLLQHHVNTHEKLQAAWY